MGKQLTEWVYSVRWWVLGASVLLVLGLTSGATRLVMSNDYRVFFGEDNPQLAAYDAMQAEFNKSDNVSFVVVPAGGEVFDPEHLMSLQDLTEKAWQIPYSRRVDSITNYQHTFAEEDDLIVEDLIFDPQAMDSVALDQAALIALSEPQLFKKVIAENKHVSVVNVTVEMPNINPQSEVPEVAAYVRQMKADYLNANPGSQVFLSGVIMMNASFAEAGQNDTVTYMPLMLAVVFVSVVLFLRTVTGAVLTLVVIFFSIFASFGFAGWVGFPLTGPMFSAIQMILTLAVADCIHILSSLVYEMRRGMPKREAIVEALRVNFQPVFLTSITTAIGFLSMNFSDSPPFHHLGNTVAFGVMVAFALSVTFLPAALYVLPLKVKPINEQKSDQMAVLSHFVVKHRKALLPGSALLMTVVICFMPLNQANDDFVKYFDDSVPFRAATDFMQENVSGMTLLEVAVDSGESSGVNSPEFLGELGQFSAWLRAQDEVDHVSTLTDTMMRLNRNMHADNTDFYRLPENQELAAQYLLLYEMSLPYGLDLNNQLNIEKSATRLIVTLKNATSVELIAFENKVKGWVEQQGSGYTYHVASPNLMFAHIGQRNITSMLEGTFAALILISVLLGIALRSLKFGLISLLPNLAPAGIGFGLWYVIDGQVGLGLSVVAGMTLGIVVDDTVHFLSKYLRARREKGMNSEDSVHYAFSNVGRALLYTTLILVAGFMVLAQSSFKLNADMGLLTALTILIALIVDFFFLPPLLMSLDKDEQSSKKNQNQAAKTVQPNAEANM